MLDTESFDVVIVGSGPCGVSTALHLQRLAPEIGVHTLVIEKERHPRHKLCGGGLTWHAQRMLRKLDLKLTVPAVNIHDARFRYDDREVAFRVPNVIRIVRRDEFDASLVAQARERGVQIREGCELTGLQLDGGDVILPTTAGLIRAKAVVAADGAKSAVRHKLNLDSPSRVSRLMEVLTPEDPTLIPEFRHHQAVFDFTQVTDGVQGYCWDFPSLVKGQATMNRGIFDSRVHPERPKGDLKGSLRDYLAARGRRLEDYPLMGNPERWFDHQAQFAVPHILLAGDAAGVEPLLGEGISFALEYGEVAAQALKQAFATGDFGFADYRHRLVAHHLGRTLIQRTRLARFCYSIRSRRFLRMTWPMLNFVSTYVARRLMRDQANWALTQPETANEATFRSDDFSRSSAAK